MTIDVAIRHALDRITLDVQMTTGDGLTALLGPSGAGKTRTLDAIAGLFRPDSARIVIDGVVMTDTDARVWVPPHERRIGYVFQDARLFPHLTVRQNLAFGRWFNRARRAPDARIAFDDVVELLDLAPFLARHPGKLSGGERRRVTLGRALLSNPRLLLLDEPLGSLDASKRQEILPYLDRLITDLRLPMIYVTHDWREVDGRAVHTMRIEEGRGRMTTN
ncbi:MAG TPA: ATP-binding cassette domain-containing protein [Vicinamibacterales bacterium]|nr:ATP-binding cassette domain-containing protein [Vicinamibacterales bacterium]